LQCYTRTECGGFEKERWYQLGLLRGCAGGEKNDGKGAFDRKGPESRLSF
jgi:hypothetical protein